MLRFNVFLQHFFHFIINFKVDGTMPFKSCKLKTSSAFMCMGSNILRNILNYHFLHFRGILDAGGIRSMTSTPPINLLHVHTRDCDSMSMYVHPFLSYLSMSSKQGSLELISLKCWNAKNKISSRQPQNDGRVFCINRVGARKQQSVIGSFCARRDVTTAVRVLNIIIM